VRKAQTPPVPETSDGNPLHNEVQGEPDNWWDNGSVDGSPEASMQTDSAMSVTSFSQESLQPQTMDLYTPSPTEISPSFDFSPFNHFTDFDTALSFGTPGQISLDPSARVVPDVEKWRTSNDAFIFGIDTGKRSIGESKIINSHAAYKAILWGCDTMEEIERSHPLWLALRQVDEKVFGDWRSKAQKIAMMFVCHRMLLVRSILGSGCMIWMLTACSIDRILARRHLRGSPPFSGLGMFFYEYVLMDEQEKLRCFRPSQETIQHPAVIDFLIWYTISHAFLLHFAYNVHLRPGLRDRLVFSHKRYTITGDFSAAFCENLHFHWPFSNDEIMIFDPASQTFMLSPLFQEYAFDLKNWTMKEGFFEKYREMRYDIPSSGCWGSLDEFFDFMPMVA
jgi:hypothetical protein